MVQNVNLVCRQVCRQAVVVREEKETGRVRRNHLTAYWRRGKEGSKMSKI